MFPTDTKMHGSVLSLLLLVLSSFIAVDCLRCNEGMNVTVFGVPLYHWNERACIGSSSCFAHEIGLTVDVPVMIRYGGCISKSYASQFTCRKLFSNDSNFNPSTLLSLVTDSDEFIENIAKDLKANATKYVHQFFSRGTGTKEFVDGIFAMNEAAGFDMSKAQSLKQPLTDFLSAIFSFPNTIQNVDAYLSRITNKENGFLQAFGKLDVKELVSTDKIYSFFRGMSPVPDQVEQLIKTSRYRNIYENLPGLLRSMIGKENEASKWFDVMINICSKINIRNVKQSATDALNEIKEAITVQPHIRQTIINPIFDTFPDFLDAISRAQSVTEAMEKWTMSLLMKYSNKTQYSKDLSSKISQLTKALMLDDSLAPLFGSLVEGLPGLFQTFTQIHSADIERVYNTLADGMASFNLTDLAHSIRMERTKMSEFLLLIVRNVKQDMSERNETLIINFSKIFYDAFPVEYKNDLDTFFSTLISGCSQFPKIDSGKLLKDLIRNFGQKGPVALFPLLDRLQDLIDAFPRDRMHNTLLHFITKLKDLAIAYENTFSKSKFPSIIVRYISFLELSINQSATSLLSSFTPPCQYPDIANTDERDLYIECIETWGMKKAFKLYKKNKILNAIDVDLFFAAVEATGITSDSYIENALAQNQTFVAAYSRLMKSLDSEDVKDLLNDYDMWLMNIFRTSDNYKFDNFILAVNYTMDKIITKAASVMKDIRYVHTPESCRDVICNTDVCNTHRSITEVTPLTKSEMRLGMTDLRNEIITPPSQTTSFASPMKARVPLFIYLVLLSLGNMGLLA